MKFLFSLLASVQVSGQRILLCLGINVEGKSRGNQLTQIHLRNLPLKRGVCVCIILFVNLTEVVCPRQRKFMLELC